MSGSCPACGEATLEDASFCEACGTELGVGAPSVAPSDVPPCVECGAAGDNITDGYCLVCGHKQPGPRDHVEIDLGTVAGVTDRGLRHHQNEDAMALAVINGAAVIVVADGVSTTDNPELASQAAVDASLEVLSRAVIEGGDLEVAMTDAAAAAQAAVVAVPVRPGGEGNPSCTLTAAVVRSAGEITEVTVGWLGDSRAYWLGEDPELLTTDHSWAGEMTASGALTTEAAAADPRAGVITRWLGRDAENVRPSVGSRRFEGVGRVVVCSDGLWNYVADAAELNVEAASDGAPLEEAASLTRFALESGGRDNVTVVVAAVPRTHPVAAPSGDGP